MPPAKYDALVNDSEPEIMTQIQLIGFFVAPLALLAIGWAVAIAVDWRAHHGD